MDGTMALCSFALCGFPEVKNKMFCNKKKKKDI